MTLLTNTSTIVSNAIFAISLALGSVYSIWHRWWDSGFGRSFMTLIIAPAVARIAIFLRDIGVRPGYDFSLSLAWLGTASRAAVFTSLAYLLVKTIIVNVRARDPRRRGEQAMRYLERIPGATELEIKDLTERWRELQEQRVASLAV